MSSEQTMSVRPGYVLVERPQDYEVVWSEQRTSLMEILAFCTEAGCRKVLVRGQRTKVSLSTLDLFTLGQLIAKLCLQVGVVESHDASDKRETFLANVAANRGGLIQFFDNEQEAKDWLCVT